MSATAWNWEELDLTDSTNRVALDRIAQRWQTAQSAHGLAILARKQSGGRGQHGRVWESPPGGLYLSAVLEDVPLELRPCLALAAGACTLSALDALGASELRIRWPNDIVLPSGNILLKLGGILCQAVAQGDRWAVVVGIGINIASQPFSSALAATSLQAMGLQSTPRHLAEMITAQLATLPDRPLADVIAHVRRRDALFGRTLRLYDHADAWDGVAEGIDDAGSLRLRLATGDIRTFERGTLHPPT